MALRPGAHNDAIVLQAPENVGRGSEADSGGPGQLAGRGVQEVWLHQQSEDDPEARRSQAARKTGRPSRLASLHMADVVAAQIQMAVTRPVNEVDSV
jgi:hypothetical protein